MKFSNYIPLYCTKEVLVSLNEALQIASNYSSSLTINSIHLLLGLLCRSKLVQKILKIEKCNFKKEIILNSIFPNIEKKKKLENSNIKLSIDILEILNVLNSCKIPFNTLTLFYYLYKKNYDLFNLILKIFNIKLDNSYFIGYSLSKIIIPNVLQNIIKIMEPKENILGREKEIIQIREILDRELNRNIILTGEKGVGKYSLIKKLSKNFQEKIFIELNILNFFSYLNNNSELSNTLFNFIESNPNIIICCRDLNILFDSSISDSNFLKTKLLEKLKTNKIQLIGTMLPDIYDKLRSEYNDFKILFSLINIKEPTKVLLQLILKQYINTHKYKSEIIIFDNILEDLVNLTSKYIKDFYFPVKGFIILDSLFNKYKYLKNKKIITKKDIIKIVKTYTNNSVVFTAEESNLFKNIKNIEVDLKKKIYGQNIAITKIMGSLKRAHIGLKDKNKPIGSWLLCGPSGTGKTELVKSLAELLFGTEKNLIRFDMSEFMEKHSISKLIGSPPGYIGFEEGGLLTEAVKERPYSIILFDEIEKAHQDINNIMLQLLDEGVLTDSKGEHVDFTNTLIIFTSNLGCPTSPLDFKSFREGTEMNEQEYIYLSKKVDLAVKGFFKPEFLNRLDSIIVFKPLSISCLSNIINKFIYNLSIKLKENEIPLTIEIDKNIKILLARISYHPLYGARPLKRTIEQFIEKPISELIISYKIKTPHIMSIYLDKNKNNVNYLLYKV